MEEMSPKERAVWDAKAKEEALDFAWRILEPWVESAREIGSPPLTRVMENALAELEKEGNVVLDKLEQLERGEA